jgi:hypothetical protein
MKIRHTALAVALTLGLGALPLASAGPAQAVGCLSGAVAGSVAGHYAGGHAVVGAVGGCIVGHHLHKVQKKKEAEQKALANQPVPAATTDAPPK